MDASIIDAVTVVTGGGRGLGAAVARRCVQEGADVVVVDLAVSDDVPGTSWVEADVTSEQATREAVARVLETHGRVDSLVNCAGVIGPIGPVHETPADLWRRTLEINLTGTFLMCAAVLPGMLGRGAGQIVNVASAAGVEHSAGQAAYNASKAGVISLTKTLAREIHPHGLRVNAVCPGPLDTAMIAEFVEQEIPDASESVRANQEAHRELQISGALWKPEEVLDLIVFLLSPAGARMNGQFLRMSSKAAPGVHN